MQHRLDTLISKHNDTSLDHVIQFIERLGASVALMAGSAAIMKYHQKLVTVAPSIAFTIGLLLFICSFFVLAWVGFGGWWRLVKTRGYTLTNHFIGANLVAISSIFVTACVYSAIGV